MRANRLGFLGLAAVMVWGCENPFGSDNELTLEFTTDSSQFYTVTSPSCPMYCRAWRRDTVTFTGVLRVSGGSGTLTTDADYSGTGTFTGQISAELEAPASVGCKFMSLHGTRSSGTFAHQQDCHGLSRAGRYTRK